MRKTALLIFLCAALTFACTPEDTIPQKSNKVAATEEENETPGEETPDDQTVTPEEKSGTVNGGSTLKLSENYIRKGSLLEVKLTFDSFEGVSINRGENTTFYAYWIEITPTKLIAKRYASSEETLSSVEHGLNISKDLSVVIDYNDASTASVTLTSGSSSKKSSVSWWGGGRPFLKNLGSSPVEASIKFTPRDCKYSVWIIGDSYIDWKYNARWPYYLYEKGYKKWMGDHLPGGGSEKMLTSFKNDIKFAKPEYAIWCMGMNDGNDSSSAPVSSWLSSVKSFISTCESNGITPILTTVPSIPSRDHSKKSKWVRESGYRYIDFSAAVTENDSKTWASGCLSSDNIHPASAGAKKLADQVEKDFPEFKTLK